MQFIVIEGNIGVGKTTLSERIATEYNAKLILEQFADNPFLPKFYNDQERYSFPLELSFLAERYKQIKDEVINTNNTNSLLISDYFFTKSAIFAEHTLSKDELNLFHQIFDIVFETIPTPDLYVYLHADTKKLISNIEKRGRIYEQKIREEYLSKIENEYFNYFNRIKSFPIVIIDVNNLDFVNNSKHYDSLKDAIFKSDYKLGINRLILR